MSGFICVDCSADTSDLEEYYMVEDPVWEAAGMTPKGGMLCIGCLETRLDRRLTPDDFLRCPLNSRGFRKSPRLLDRLAIEQGEI